MPREASDRNLLFGILAVQMDFISRDALVNAMHAWVLKKARPLGQILLEQNALTSETHALLEALVQKHLALHGNDPQQSLAAVSSVGSVKKHLEQIADPDVQASMIALSSPAKEREAGGAAAELDDLYATVSIGAPTATGQRFRILRPHAKGGLGEVFVAHDEELHREVALKEIQDRHADNQESRARFMLEAEITGGLEHPGIVPVYGLGQYADGRPFYAMRFIRGDSLQDAIEKFHNPPPSPRGRGAGGEGERQLEFRKLLGRFIDVCQAMQYAHDRGVLHRDLKPGNIMLGRYGETLVVDWGLAKATTKPDPELQRGGAESPLRPASASGSAETIAGSTIGTPAYMSPEQAAGRLDQLGPASDVYSLGATLYVLLTGKPSIEDRDIGVVLKKVQSGDIRRPRQHKPAVSPALEAICLKAIALNPGDRYATPKALADDVEKWLADEPVSAAPEPVLVRARRWMRKHPAAVSGIAAAVLVGVVSLAALAVVLGAKNAEMESANTTIAAKNTALKDANAAIGKANDDLKKSVAAETAARQEAQTNEKLAAEQRTLALQTLRLVVDDIDVQLKNKPAMQELRQKLLDKALEGLKKVARSADNSKAIDHHTVWAHFELGDLFLNLAGAGVEQAHKQYERAHAIAAQRVDVESEDSQAQRDLAISFNKLGDVSLQLGQVQTAKGYFQDSLAIGKKRADDDPKDSKAQRDLSVSFTKLGDVSLQLGQVPAAQGYYQDSLAIHKKLADADPKDIQAQRDLAISFNNLGDVSLRLGQSPAAQGYYQDSLAIGKKLADADPKDIQAQRDLAISFTKLGNVSLQLGQAPAAQGYYQDSLAIDKKRADADPKDSQAQRDLSVSFTKLGDVSLQLGQAPAAQGYYQDSVAIRKKLADADPKDIQAQRDLAISFNNLGDVSLRLGQTQAAQGYYQDSLAIFKKRADADPKDLTAQAALAVFHFKLATTAVELPDHTQARESFAEALKVLEGPQKLGMLKGTIYAGWPQFLEYRVAVCRRVEEAVADLNTALKYPPETTRELLLLRAKELARMKKLDDAAATTEYLAGLKDALGEAQFAAARAHGYMAGVADALPAKHTEQALKLLHAARASGCFDLPVNRKQLETHRDFEPFRKNADFTKLLAEIDADTGKLVLEMKADLLTTDPKDRALKESPSQVHEIKLTAGKRYAVALDRVGGGKFDPFLRLEDAERKELTRDDDSGGDLNSFLVFIPAETATYRLIVTSFDGSTGTYVLSVRERAGK